MNQQKLKKVLRNTVIAMIAIGCVYGGVMYGLIKSQMAHVPQDNADTLIVLGAKVWGTVESPRPSPVLKERLNTASAYLKANTQSQVIVTGGQGSDEPASEAQVMKDYLIQEGIEESRILIEDQSTSTKENLINAQMFGDLGTTVLVTSDYHSYRALLTAKRLGLQNVESLAAPSQSNAKFKDTVREVLALGYHIIFSN